MTAPTIAGAVTVHLHRPWRHLQSVHHNHVGRVDVDRVLAPKLLAELHSQILSVNVVFGRIVLLPGVRVCPNCGRNHGNLLGLVALVLLRHWSTHSDGSFGAVLAGGETLHRQIICEEERISGIVEHVASRFPGFKRPGISQDFFLSHPLLLSVVADGD